MELDCCPAPDMKTRSTQVGSSPGTCSSSTKPFCAAPGASGSAFSTALRTAGGTARSTASGSTWPQLCCSFACGNGATWRAPYAWMGVRREPGAGSAISAALGMLAAGSAVRCRCEMWRWLRCTLQPPLQPQERCAAAPGAAHPLHLPLLGCALCRRHAPLRCALLPPAVRCCGVCATHSKLTRVLVVLARPRASRLPAGDE